MIGPAPEFTNSKYFVPKPDWHLEAGASEEDKRALEKYMNSEAFKPLWKAENPNMKNPYYTWDGKLIEK